MTEADKNVCSATLPRAFGVYDETKGVVYHKVRLGRAMANLFKKANYIRGDAAPTVADDRKIASHYGAIVTEYVGGSRNAQVRYFKTKQLLEKTWKALGGSNE